MIRAMDASRPSSNVAGQDEDLTALRTEVERLRALVGPSEKSYAELKADARDAREAARRAELEVGRSRATIVELQNDVRRWQRDFVWFRDRVIRRLPLLGRFLNRIRPS